MGYSFQETAQFLHDAETHCKDVVRITSDRHPELTIEEAYAIQRELMRLKQEQGHEIVGPKMGLTSQAKLQQMNVDEPIYGYNFDYMVVPDGGDVSLRSLIHPKVEAEVAFVLGEDVEGPGITGAQILASTDYVLPALEIIDSRYENFNFTLPDVIADNASSSRVVYGSNVTKPERLSCGLDLVGVTLHVNGELKDSGAGAAVLGHPARSVAMLANMLGRKGEKIRKGQPILTGGVTGAIRVEEGDHVQAKVDGLGDVSFRVTP